MVLENLELIEVTYEDNMSKAVLTYLDEANGEIREVNFNKKSWDDSKSTFVDDPEKAKKVDEWCEEYFKLPFDKVTKAIGEKRDIYAYDNFNSLWEVEQIQKFDADMEGQILEMLCTEVVDDGKAVRIRFTHKDPDMGSGVYQSNMSYADYNEPRKMWFVNPQKKVRQYEKFEKKFSIPVSRKDELVGKILMIEVKKAMGKYIYAEVKPFPKKK